ncbi:MAG: hypothetical protein MUC29_10400, partial [Pyrinomonadaceae bacterium]|nr:hypothetical protein [Pyrinomonadaceae bacterium]
MRYCHECGFQVGDKDVFCSNCGIALPKIEATEENPSFSDQKNTEEKVEVSYFDENKSVDSVIQEDANDGVEDPQDWWVKTDEVAIADALKEENNQDKLPTIEKYAENTEIEVENSDSEPISENNNQENYSENVEDTKNETEDSINLEDTIVSEQIFSQESDEISEQKETEIEETESTFENEDEISQETVNETNDLDLENVTQDEEITENEPHIEHNTDAVLTEN